MLSISIISGEDGNIVFPSFNLNFTDEIEQNDTTNAEQQNKTEFLDDNDVTAKQKAFSWNITIHTEGKITGQL